EYLLSRVSGRRQHVRGEDRERFHLRQPLVDQLRGGERAAENDALDSLDGALDATARPAAYLGGGDVTGSNRFEAQLTRDDSQIRRTCGRSEPDLPPLDPKWGLCGSGAVMPREEDAVEVAVWS